MSLAQARYKRLITLLAIDTPPTISISGTTTNGVTLVIGTGFDVPAGASAKLDGFMTIKDTTAQTAYSKNISATLKNFGGEAVAGTPQIGGGNGDSALSTSTVTFSFGGGLHVTLTPPSGYSGSIDWTVELTPTIN